jgi:hypothetical protein
MSNILYIYQCVHALVLQHSIPTTHSTPNTPENNRSNEQTTKVVTLPSKDRGRGFPPFFCFFLDAAIGAAALLSVDPVQRSATGNRCTSRGHDRISYTSTPPLRPRIKGYPYYTLSGALVHTDRPQPGAGLSIPGRDRNQGEPEHVWK